MTGIHSSILPPPNETSKSPQLPRDNETLMKLFHLKMGIESNLNESTLIHLRVSYILIIRAFGTWDIQIPTSPYDSPLFCHTFPPTPWVSNGFGLPKSRRAALPGLFRQVYPPPQLSHNSWA